MRSVFLNGDTLPESEARISIFDRAVLFADAIYEVISVVDGAMIDFDHHMARLRRSLEELTIVSAMTSADWKSACETLIEGNGLAEGVLYLQVSRGTAADRDFYFPPEGTPATHFAFTQEKTLINNPMAQRGMRVITRQDRRWQLRDIKTVQLLYASMMKMEARGAGVDDVWLTDGDTVTEGTSQNAHIITRAGHLVTHPLDRLILHGVTRLTLVEIARKAGMTVEERPFTIAEAQNAAEAFVTAATMFVMPVVEIDGLSVGDGTPGWETLALRKAYIRAVRQSVSG